MKTLVLILVMGLCSLSSNSVNCLKMDLVLLLDFSGSLDGEEEHGHVISALNVFVEKFILGEDNVKISIIIFNDYPIFISHLSSNKKELQKSIDKIKYYAAKGNTNMKEALNVAYEELMFSEFYRENARKTIILISDGIPSEGENNMGETLKISEEIKSCGVNICGVWIPWNKENGYYYHSNKTGKEFMEKVISSSCFVVSKNYAELALAFEKLDPCF